MKNLICKNSYAVSLLPKRLVFMAGEKEQAESLVAPQVVLVGNETVNDAQFLEIRNNADKTLDGFVTAKTNELAGKQQVEKKADEERLKDPKLKPADKNKYTKENKEREVARKKEWDTLMKDLEDAKTQALAKLDAAYEATKAKKEQNSKALAEGISGVLLDRKLESRAKNVDKDVAEMVSKFSFKPIKLVTYKEGKDGKPIAVAGKDISLDSEGASVAVAEMIKSIYMTQGPDAARAKVEELQRICGENDTLGKYMPLARLDVKLEDINKVFARDGGKGSLQAMLEKFYLDPDGMDAKKLPALLGKAAGNLQSAEVIFSKDRGTDKFYAQYEKAVQDAVTKGEEPPTPNDWAKKNAPEALIEKKDPKQLIESVIKTLKKPEIDGKKLMALVKTKLDATPKMDFVTDSQLPMKIRDQATAELQAEVDKAFADRKSAISSMLTGVLAAEPDSSKWDVLVKQALTSMTVQKDEKDYKLDLGRLSTFDYSTITAGREMYGDSRKFLSPDAKKIVSGLVMGGDFTYGGKQIDITKDGKTEKADYMVSYKKFVDEALGKKGPVRSKIDEAETARKEAIDAVERDQHRPATKEERAKIDGEYNAAVEKIVSEELTPQKFEASLPKVEAPKKEEEKKPEEKEKGKGKGTGSGTPKKVEGGGGTGGGGKSKEAPTKPEAPAQPKSPEPVAKEKGGDKGKKTAEAPAQPPAKQPEGPAKPPEGPAKPPEGPKPPLVVATDGDTVEITLSPELKKQIGKILTDVVSAPRPKEGYSPTFVQGKINEGLAALPEGSLQPGKQIKGSGIVIEVGVNDKGKYEGKVVQAAPGVKKQFGLDVPDIGAPAKKKDEKLASTDLPPSPI